MSIVQASTRSEQRPVARAVPLSVPHLAGNEWAYVKACLDSGQISGAGGFVERFEQDLAGYVGAGHAVAVTSGTTGLHVALRVVGVEPDDEVLVPTLTFIAPVNAVRYCGAHPVLIGPDPQTWQMDPQRVAAFLTQTCALRNGACYNRSTGRRVRAIVPVHLLGLSCEIDSLVALARRYQLRVVEDAAEGMGVRYRGRHVGTFGDVGVLSFNGNKVMTAAGGGALVTDDAAVARRVRYLIQQAKDDPCEFIHEEIGYNYRLSSIQASVGVAQLEQLPGFLERKRAIAGSYRSLLGAVPGLTVMPVPPHTEPTYWLYTVLLEGGTTRDERQRVVRILNDRGIEARPLWRPMHQVSPHRGCQCVGAEAADAVYARAVSLPSSVGLSPDDLEACAQALLEVVHAR